jgi:glycosyltransferase involved in cell wall biosynthesis
MKLAYVTLYDPNDTSHWSGLGHAILHALRDQGAEVVPLGPLTSRLGAVKLVAERIAALRTDKYYEFERERIVAWDYAQQVSRKLRGQSFDAVICPGAPIAVSALRCREPIILWSGATFNSLVQDYGFVEMNCRASIAAGNRRELAALKHARLVLFASDWAAQSALRDYGTDASKVRVVPFGAILRSPPSRDQVLRSIAGREMHTCRLISVGVEWGRKGIPRVMELAAALIERGQPVQLTVVGAEPPAGCNLPPWVRAVAKIDKRNEDGEHRLGELLSQSHVHALFSTAECFGLAFCEANAWGVPNLASDVGGIPSAVVNGRGGWRLDNREDIRRAAEIIEGLMRDEDAYRAAAWLARDEYEQRLNWRVAGAAAMRHIESAITGTTRAFGDQHVFG